MPSKTTGKGRTGRPAVHDDRARFSCRLPPDLDAMVRRELTEKRIARARVGAIGGADRPFDAGDVIAEGMRFYFERRKAKR